MTKTPEQEAEEYRKSVEPISHDEDFKTDTYSETDIRNAFLAGYASGRREGLEWVLQSVATDCMDMLSDEYRALKRRIEKEME